MAQCAAALVGLSDRAADPSGRRPRAQSGRGAARPRCSATSPSSSGRSIRRRWSASSAPRSAAGGGNTRPAPFSATHAKAKARLQTALNAGHLGALELRSAGIRAGRFRHLQGIFRPQAGRATFTYQDLLAVDPSRRSRAACWTSWSNAIRTGEDYAIEYRTIWPDGSLHWVEVRARAVRRPDGSIKSLVGVCLRHHRAQDRRNRARELAGAAGCRAHRAGGTDRHAGAARRAAHRGADEGSRGPREGAGAVAPGAEDGDDRPAHRRRRARLQQSADGGDGQSRSAAQAHSGRSARCSG